MLSHQAPSGGGEPLDTATRTAMEQRFSQPFADVRVHTSPSAAAAARQLFARAFTKGHNVYFDSGQYAPETHDGQRLLVHELIHVLQQRGRSSASNSVPLSSPSDPGEREADTLSHQVVSRPGVPTPIQASSQPAMIQRDLNYDLFLKGENYWFPNQGQARIAALARATALGPGHTITHHPTPAVGQPHYHIVDPAGRQVVGHFFYGGSPPIKEREQSRYRERAKEQEEAEEKERLRRRAAAAAKGAAIGAGAGLVLGGIVGAIGGGAGGTLVAPGIGTIGGGAAGAVAGAEAGAPIGAAIGTAIGGLIGWLTE